jgi:addiction module HigA family antidote
MPKKKLKPIHPGEVLLEEFLKPFELSQHRLADGIAVSPRRISEIISAKRSVTADIALRLARYFHTSPQFWLGLQMDYDLDIAAGTLAGRLAREVKPHTLAA